MSRITYPSSPSRSSAQTRSSQFSSAHFRILFTLGSIVFLSAATLTFVRGPWLRVTRITVEGATPAINADVLQAGNRILDRSYAWMIPGRFFPAVRPDALETELLRQFPRIADVSIQKDFPETITISLTERTLFAVFCGGRPHENAMPLLPVPPCVWIDVEGFAYERAPETTGSLMLKIISEGAPPTLGIKIMEHNAIQTMHAVKKHIEDIGLRITQFIILADVPSELRAITHEGIMLILKQDGDSAKTATAMPPIVTAARINREKRVISETGSRAAEADRSAITAQSVGISTPPSVMAIGVPIPSTSSLRSFV